MYRIITVTFDLQNFRGIIIIIIVGARFPQPQLLSFPHASINSLYDLGLAISCASVAATLPIFQKSNCILSTFYNNHLLLFKI